MPRKTISTLTGFICCFAMIIFGIASNGGIATILNFIHFPSMVVTFGGAIFAVMMTTSDMKEFFDGIGSIKKAFTRGKCDLDNIAEEIYDMSQLARKEGLLALEERSDGIENAYMKKGIRLTVDGTDQDLVKDILETEMINHVEESKSQIQFWESLGAYGPAWGMVGTLLGLINMMKSMGTDASSVGAGMSLALLTTLYGSILANWICIPIAAKLRKISSEEELEMSLIVEGVLSIQAGDNPAVIKEKIRAFRNDWEERQAA